MIFSRLFFVYVKHGLGGRVKDFFSHNILLQGGNGGIFSRDIDVLSVSLSSVSGGRHNED